MSYRRYTCKDCQGNRLAWLMETTPGTKFYFKETCRDRRNRLLGQVTITDESPEGDYSPYQQPYQQEQYSGGKRLTRSMKSMLPRKYSH